MKSRMPAALILALILGACAPSSASQDEFPTQDWPTATPSEVGLDAAVLDAVDADIRNGDYSYVDSMLVIRHGKLAYERYYEHDYATIYGEESRTPGPLVVNDPSGPYNYFNPWWHPYYQQSSLHTMQSVTKSVVSAIVGVAVGRGDFPSLDTPVLSFFDVDNVKNVDESKRSMTLRHLLTMSTGLEWDEDGVDYADPTNTFVLMTASPDWVQYTLDRPMAHRPGDVYEYNGGATLILGHVFRLATGVDLEEYAVEHLFEPLGIRDYFWKRTPFGLVDTQEGLYVSSRDIAKVAYLFLKGGNWEGQQVVPGEWVEASIAPSFTDIHNGVDYGYLWWLRHYQYRGEGRVAASGSGFGGQRPVFLPELDLVLVFTGWDILEDRFPTRTMIERVLEAVQ